MIGVSSRYNTESFTMKRLRKDLTVTRRGRLFGAGEAVIRGSNELYSIGSILYFFAAKIPRLTHMIE